MAANPNRWIAAPGGDGSYATTGNWSDGTPDAGDFIRLMKSSISIIGGLDQSLVALGGFRQWLSYTGNIGLYPITVSPGTAGTYLQIDTPELLLGIPDDGSTPVPTHQRLMFNLGAGLPCTTTIKGTASMSPELGMPPVRLLGNDAAHDILLESGWVGIAVNLPTETSSFRNVTCGVMGLRRRMAKMTLGPGATTTGTLEVCSGRCLNMGIPANIVCRGGTLVHDGVGAVSGNITVHAGGHLIANSIGTVGGTITVYPKGTLDLSQSDAARDYGTITWFDGANVIGAYNPAVTATRNAPKTGGGSGLGDGGGVM